MALTYYALSSYHEDPEYQMSEVPDFIPVTTKHSPNMAECVARSLHETQVRKELDEYEMGLKPLPGYKINRYDYDPEIPF